MHDSWFDIEELSITVAEHIVLINQIQEKLLMILEVLEKQGLIKEMQDA